MNEQEIIHWLLEGDVSIQYQVHRDLLGEDRPDLRDRIAHEGWGKAFLDKRKPDGHWGQSFYQPKWTSTHYTLLDLKNLGIDPQNEACRESVSIVLNNRKDPDGGINPAKTVANSDMCVNGMFLNYACYFGAEEDKLRSVMDFILGGIMGDGGFNCRFNRSGAVHSSLHTTLSMLEGFQEYIDGGYNYRLGEVKEVVQSSQEFVLLHQFYLSDRTGEIIHKDFLRFAYPCRWRYDILRGLDHFQSVGHPFDPRMERALQVVKDKRKKSGQWTASTHAGNFHFRMKEPRQPSRWNTLRALRVLKAYEMVR